MSHIPPKKWSHISKELCLLAVFVIYDTHTHTQYVIILSFMKVRSGVMSRNKNEEEIGWLNSIVYLFKMIKAHILYYEIEVFRLLFTLKHYLSCYTDSMFG